MFSCELHNPSVSTEFTQFRNITSERGTEVGSRRNVLYTWAVCHCVKVTISQHQMLRPTLRFQSHSDVSDTVVEAGKAPKKVNRERATGPLHIHSELV